MGLSKSRCSMGITIVIATCRGIFMLAKVASSSPRCCARGVAPACATPRCRSGAGHAGATLWCTPWGVIAAQRSVGACRGRNRRRLQTSGEPQGRCSKTRRGAPPDGALQRLYRSQGADRREGSLLSRAPWSRDFLRVVCGQKCTIDRPA